MIIQNATVFTEDGTFQKGSVFLNGDVFAASADGPTLDADGLYAIPGLTDIHFHGCVGHDFCDGTKEALDAIAQYQAKNGVTALVPASMTLPEEKLLSVYRNFAAYSGAEGAMYLGINMEGPFFSAAKKGAQNASYLLAPDLTMFERLQQACGRKIKLADIAPELPGAIEYIRTVSKETTVSLAHTTADYDTASRAFSDGASHVTHLYNAMPPFSHRDPGVVGAACDAKADVELICDGVHIHPSVVRATLRLFGEDRVSLISDSMMATGLTDGEYALGGQPVTVRGNRATLADGTIAGSATNLFDCMRTAVKFGIPLETAIRLAAVNPVKAVREYDKLGSITPGKFANFVLMDKDLHIQAVYVKGKKIA